MLREAGSRGPLTEPAASLSSKGAGACGHTHIRTEMARHADQPNRVQCLYLHLGKHEQHSHTFEHEGPSPTPVLN